MLTERAAQRQALFSRCPRFTAGSVPIAAESVQIRTEACGDKGNGTVYYWYIAHRECGRAIDARTGLDGYGETEAFVGKS